jgi:hypothetical protein
MAFQKLNNSEIEIATVHGGEITVTSLYQEHAKNNRKNTLTQEESRWNSWTSIQKRLVSFAPCCSQSLLLSDLKENHTLLWF